MYFTRNGRGCALKNPGNVPQAHALGTADLNSGSFFNTERVSRVLNEHAAISPDFAVRLESGGIGEAAHWLRMQAAHDLAEAKAKEKTTSKDSLRPRKSRHRREAGHLSGRANA